MAKCLLPLKTVTQRIVILRNREVLLDAETTLGAGLALCTVCFSEQD